MNADGSNQQIISYNSADDSQSSWSPDGSKIAFTSRRDGNAEIYIMNVNGSGQRNISNNNSWDVDPAWSPVQYKE